MDNIATFAKGRGLSSVNGGDRMQLYFLVKTGFPENVRERDVGALERMEWLTKFSDDIAKSLPSRITKSHTRFLEERVQEIEAAISAEMQKGVNYDIAFTHNAGLVVDAIKLDLLRLVRGEELDGLPDTERLEKGVVGDAIATGKSVDQIASELGVGKSEVEGQLRWERDFEKTQSEFNDTLSPEGEREVYVGKRSLEMPEFRRDVSERCPDCQGGPCVCRLGKHMKRVEQQ